MIKQRRVYNAKRFLRNFLRINNSREFFVFLFFLLVAFIFWYLMTMNNEYEMTFSPSLRLKNVPEDMMVVEPLPEKIDIVIRDKGDKLMGYKARRKFKELVVDYRQHANVKGYTAIYGSELVALLDPKRSSSSQIVSISHDTLQYYVASSHGVKFPVKVAGNIAADSQFGIHRVEVIPDSVTVYAVSAYLDSLQAVYIPEVHYVGLKDSLSQMLTLDAGVRGVKFEPSEVMLNVAVSPYVTKVVEVPVSGYLFPYGISLKTFPSKAKVVFRVSLEDYSDVTEKDFALHVHYSQIQNNTSGKVAPRLSAFPGNINNVRIEPGEVDYLLEVNALPAGR